MTEKRKKVFLASFIFTLLIISGIFLWNKLSGPYLYAMPSLFQIVENWAPVIKQGTEGNFDFITKFDYDGDWYGSNNWNSFDRNSGNLQAYVYYAIIESNNYYFITYMFFHPKDVGSPFCGFCSSHENDSEGCRMVIYKDGSPYGKLELLETVAHYDKYTYRPGADIPIYSAHPTVYIVPYKHAVYGTNYAKSGWDRAYLDDGRVFPSKDGGGIEYYYGGYAELPQSHTGINFCSYNLINMESTIWANRLTHAYTYGECDFFTSSFWEGRFYFDPDFGFYRWRCFQIRSPKFGSRFYGNDYSSKWGWLPFVGSDIEAGPNAASAPWNYDFTSYGTWFIDPYASHYGRNMSTCTLLNGESYIYNPYRYSSSCCTDGAINGLNVKKSVSQYLIEAGESVTYTYEVTNAFIYPARNVKILDDQLGLIQSIDFLEPNQTWTIQKIVTLNQTTTNQAIATCNYSDNGNEVVSYSSNKITVFIGEPPPDEPPPDEPPPLPQAYAVASKVLVSCF